jgi:hypothetical protein
MNLKLFVAGAVAAVGLTVSAAPAQAFIFGWSWGAGAQLVINGGEHTLWSDYGTSGNIYDPSNGPATVGNYSGGGLHDLTNDNYGVVGDFEFATDPPYGDPLPDNYNNYFVFDLSELAGVDITSAELLLNNHDMSRPEWYRLGAYTGDVDGLLANHAEGDADGQAIFNALGSGLAFGFFQFTPWGPSDPFLALGGPANSSPSPIYSSGYGVEADFLDTLKDAIGTGKLVLGGRVASRLEATGVVPEPATWAMMIVGFMGVGAALRARRRTAATA